MPYKNQEKCFRTIKGEKYINYCDILSDDQQIEIDKLKQAGKRIKLIKHPDGFYQAFIHSNDC